MTQPNEPKPITTALCVKIWEIENYIKNGVLPTTWEGLRLEEMISDMHSLYDQRTAELAAALERVRVLEKIRLAVINASKCSDPLAQTIMSGYAVQLAEQETGDTDDDPIHYCYEIDRSVCGQLKTETDSWTYDLLKATCPECQRIVKTNEHKLKKRLQEVESELKQAQRCVSNNSSNYKLLQKQFDDLCMINTELREKVEAREKQDQAMEDLMHHRYPEGTYIEDDYNVASAPPVDVPLPDQRPQGIRIFVGSKKTFSPSADGLYFVIDSDGKPKYYCNCDGLIYSSWNYKGDKGYCEVSSEWHRLTPAQKSAIIAKAVEIRAGYVHNSHEIGPYCDLVAESEESHATLKFSRFKKDVTCPLCLSKLAESGGEINVEYGGIYRDASSLTPHRIINEISPPEYQANDGKWYAIRHLSSSEIVDAAEGLEWFKHQIANGFLRKEYAHEKPIKTILESKPAPQPVKLEAGMLWRTGLSDGFTYTLVMKSESGWFNETGDGEDYQLLHDLDSEINLGQVLINNQWLSVSTGTPVESREA